MVAKFLKKPLRQLSHTQPNGRSHGPLLHGSKQAILINLIKHTASRAKSQLDFGFGWRSGRL